MGFINQKLGVDTAESLRNEISARIKDYNFENLADDVSSFLVDPEDIKRVVKFKEFWDQVGLD
jgi:hypothetical protein